MVWLVVETFVLMLAFVAAGILLGIALRSAFGAAAEPAYAGPAGIEQDADEEPPLPAKVVVQRPMPVPLAREAAEEPVPDRAPAPVVVAEPPASQAAPAADLPAAEAIIDPVKAAAADQVGARPSALAGARDGVPDDLKRIKGIGPQNEARLNALGVFHFDQIAAWTPEEARWVGSYLAFPGRIEREDWIGQARRLAG